MSTLEKERDLYRKLLSLGDEIDLDAFVDEALSLVVEIAEADRGYLQVEDPDGTSLGSRWWSAHNCSGEQTEDIRCLISTGIIASALASGEVVETASALLDPRFRERSSVQVRGIEAVLCVPIGVDPPLGAIYLQGRPEPGPFPPRIRADVELIARHLAPFLDRLILRLRTSDGDDATRELRARYRLDGFVGRSQAIASVLERILPAAALDVSVLLTGPTGTGKSQLARLLHENSQRASGPFVELNCATLPDTLVESELFGAVPGAHSTATRAIRGKVAAAERGTLLLDEIGDLPLSEQPKLLQLLQSREYYPLGSARPVRADVRVIAATNVDLDEAVRERRFRADLLHRLAVIRVRMPALAERRADVADLARLACAQASRRHNLPLLELSSAACRALWTMEWPGNVRELFNTVEGAAIRAATECAVQIELRHLFPGDADRAGGEHRPLTFQEATRYFQRDFLLQVLDEEQWNISRAAARLDLARSHVYNLVHSFGLASKLRRV